MIISTEFKNTLKLHCVPKFQLAWQAGISPSTLSHLLNGHQKLISGDERLLRIAKLIDFPADRVFTKTE